MAQEGGGHGGRSRGHRTCVRVRACRRAYFDYGLAMKLYRKAAGLGMRTAMNNLGYLYRLGVGGGSDDAEVLSGKRNPRITAI